MTPPERATARLPRRIPSIGRIVASDYASLLCVIAPIVAWGLWLVVEVLGIGRKGPPGEGLTFLLGLALASAACVPMLALRAAGIRRVFRDGAEVEGRVISVGFHEDRGTVEVEFTHGGEVRRVSEAIHKNARTTGLRQGEPVVLVIDPDRPDRAFIRDLFL